jgi:hypothetical protein
MPKMRQKKFVGKMCENIQTVNGTILVKEQWDKKGMKRNQTLKRHLELQWPLPGIKS